MLLGEVDDGEFGVFEDLVGVFEHGVELERLAGSKFVALAGEGDGDPTAEDPADLVVIAVSLRMSQRAAGLGGGVEAVDALERQLLEIEGA